jgi:predicted permease
MSFLGSPRFRIASLFGRSQISAEMEEELRSHVQHRADDLEHSGLSRTEAERRARVEFGGYAKYKEQSYEAAGSHFVETFGQDLRFSVRTLRKSPGFAIAAIGTLALAIAANAVVFSILNAFILRPLNVAHPDSLYALFRQPDNDASEWYPDFRDLRERSTRSFESVMAYNIGQVALDTGSDPSQVWIEEASGNYFDALGVRPYLGRLFHDSDEHGANSAPYIVLTHAFWKSHFQSDRSVIGRVVQLNKHPYTIIGIAQPEFHGTLIFFNPDFFTPLVNDPELGGSGLEQRGGKRWIFMVMGHLRPGVTPAQAVADLNSTGAYLEKSYPKDEPKMTFALNRPSLYGDFIGRPARQFLTGLLLLAGLILLAACANLGSLFAARAADRSREVALRLALGSSRRRILRGMFAEAMLLSLAGGAVGLSGSVLLLRELSAWQPFARWPLHLDVNPDAKVYALALVLAVVSGLLFGVVPVRQVLHTNPYEVVKAGANNRVGRRVTLRDVLLVVQTAICGVLVTASLVAVRGLARSLHHNFGFDVHDSILADTSVEMAGYTGDKVPAMQKRILEEVESIPGVESVGLADTVPLGHGENDSNVFTDGATDLRPAKAADNVAMYRVSPEYFHAASTTVLSGRAFTWHDDASSPRVAVVNGEFARKIFNSPASAMGGYFKMPDGARVQVVGIVEDGKYASLTEKPQPALFLPILQSPSSSTYLVVRSRSGVDGDPAQLVGAMRNKLRELDPGLPVYIETRYKELDAMLFGPRMATLALGVLGTMGAILSLTGIFGMAAYTVSKRLRELGIRMALGAQRKEVLQTALSRPLKLLVFGSAAGLIFGVLASRVLALIVDQATPRDPLVLAGVVLAMALLGLLATWIPAQRALSVNPLILLREE